MVKEWFGIVGGNALAFLGAILATVKAEDFSAWSCAGVGIVVAVFSGVSVILKNKALRIEAEHRAKKEEYEKEQERLKAIVQFHRLCGWCVNQKRYVENCGNDYPPSWCKNPKVNRK